MANTIPRRRIGPDLSTGVLALGSWHTYDRMDFNEAVRMLRTAVDAGIDLFDVGVYGRPDGVPTFTDVIFSAMVRAAGLRREDYLLSTKLWLDNYPQADLRPQLENALLRSGVEHADLVVLGDLRHDNADLRQLVADLDELVRAGMVRCWGVNNWSASSVQALIDIADSTGQSGPCVAQLKHSIARRSIPDGKPFARLFEQGLALESSDVFEGGVLLGKGTERMVGRDRGEVRDHIADSAAQIRDIADGLDATPAQLCLAFTLSHPANATTLFGARGTQQLNDDMAAVDLIERVGAEELRRLVGPLQADQNVVAPEGP